MGCKFYIQDEGIYIPSEELAQSFAVLNFLEGNSFGIGTDTIVPVVNVDNPNWITDITSQDLWGFSGVGTFASIYRLTNVGIGTSVVFERFQVGAAGTDLVVTQEGLTGLGLTNPTFKLDILGDLHATAEVEFDSTLDVDGDVTFNSNTQSIDPTTGALVVTEGGVGITSGNLNVGGDTHLYGTLELDSTLIDINQGIGFTGRDFRLSSVGTGVSWRPSGVETQNTIWVTKDGNDANSGLLEGDAKATVGGAALVAQPGDTIKIRPGVYVENNPIGLQRDVTVTGEDLRLVTIQPQNPTLDVFWVRRGCLIENLNFAGENVEVNHPGCGAVAFPKDGVSANSGYTNPGPATETTRWRSPYVRNCTNFMTGSIGMRIDGNDATASIAGADLKSMVCDSFTQYNQNGIGVSITNNAYAQLVSIFTINCDKAIYVDTGGQCDLTNSNSSFGNFGLYAVGLGATQYTGSVSGNIIPDGETNDTVTATNVRDGSSQTRRPFDGQAAYFKIDLGNYAGDAVGSGRINAPLRRVARINVTNGGSGYTAATPPTVTISDVDSTVVPKGPQGIVAEVLANVSAAGTITSIDVIESGRNYLPTQNLVANISGSGGATAEVVTEPIYYTVSEATQPDGSGNTTITFNEFIPYQLYDGDPFTLQRISRILTSSHSFEYVGTGTDINTALPFEGALPIKENEIVALDGAQIPFTSTDQKGNFDIGEGIQVDQTTSTIRGRDFSKAIQAEVTPLILALR
jgi:hypothetical protein